MKGEENMAIDDKFIDQVSRGFIPPLSKALGEQPVSIIAERLFTLPGESLKWIGEGYFVAQLTSWGPPFKGSVQFGASDSRFVFIDPGGLVAGNTFSYWFDVDFEGHIWQRGAIGKKEYTALHVQPPQLKKELLSREIILANTAVRTNGKQDKILEIRLSNLKWRNPQTQKFEGGKAESLFQEMMDFYNRCKPVALRALMLITTNPGALEAEMFPAEHAEGQAIQITDTTPPPQVAKPAMEQSIPTRPPEAKAAPAPVNLPASTPATLTCPSCGRLLQTGANFCSGCHARFDEHVPVPVEKPNAKTSKTKTAAKPEPKTQASKAAPRPPAPKVVEKSQSKPFTPKAVDQPAPTIAVSPKSTAVVGLPRATCPTCGKPSRQGIIFCGYCGTNLEQPVAKLAKTQVVTTPTVCSACKNPVEKGWKACPFCGQLLLKS